MAEEISKQNVLKTGTTTLGLVGKDAVILAADKRATAGNLIANKNTEKIMLLNDSMAFTIAGTVSDVQLIAKYLKAELKLKEVKTGRKNTVKEAANLLAGMVYNNIRKMSMIPGITQFVFGGHDKEGVHLYEIFADGSITEINDFVCSGSGSEFALGVLESQYKKGLSIKEGEELAVSAIQAALARDSASGNGIDVMVITANSVKKTIQRVMPEKAV
jgi:proteasome beta subunit